MNEKRALLIIDVQPTFCEGGELPVAGGNDCAHRIADFVLSRADYYDLLVTTQDWHVDPGQHFAATPDYADTWPPHGLAGTANAELHPALVEALRSPVLSIRKGQFAAAYSGFDGVSAAGLSLGDELADRGISSVDVVGIAESHCVKATALDAVAAGLATRVLSDLTVPVTEELGAAARIELRQAGVVQEPSGGVRA